ncbi:MAG TPA: tRNA 2-selenouridine(34) synthase MnmH [Burkholderiaceae bacterium]|nr:tRNA 2-selenouridine(34) synthase MnmH [Burkholderiaceae bacterium]
MIADRAVVSCEQVLQDLTRFDALLDVRSEGEFADDHLPGAINAPVLHDAERVEVGTLYRQVSPFDARRRGAALVARNIASIVETELAQKPRDWRPLVYCWRGGQRSAALTHVLARIGWPARQLEGGYRAFRRHVMQDLAGLPARLVFHVVCGTTGSGKSRLLQQLAQAGAQVLDLEQLAHHRGSVLGGLPSLPQPSQKMFETRIWSTLRSLRSDVPVFVESESRKVGDLRVPDALIAAMRASPCVRVELPIAERVKLLRDEYVHFERDPEQLLAQLNCLVALHGRERVEQWKTLVAAGQWDQLVERLLLEHYDPAYLRSINRNFAHSAAAHVVTLARSAPDAYASAAQALAAARSS